MSLVLGLGLERVCPWSWPRIFLCPWPWLCPRVLSPRLHLCKIVFVTTCVCGISNYRGNWSFIPTSQSTTSYPSAKKLILCVCPSTTRKLKNQPLVVLENAINPVPSLRGAVPPHSALLKILFLEHHATTRQRTMMEKGIITFKHNSPLTFSQFFAKLLATNCCVT